MKIIHIKRNCKQLAKMFMRFQEFYESPMFRGKIFTRKEYLQWYKDTRGTKYEEDWAGFNIPGWVVNVFRHGCFDPLSKSEQDLINLCPDGLFYVIGTEENNINAIKHEIAHAMFYLNDDYRTQATKIIDNLPELAKHKLEHFLSNVGYHKKHFLDEMQAYVLCDKPTQITKTAHNQLSILFYTYKDKTIVIDQ